MKRQDIPPDRFIKTQGDSCLELGQSPPNNKAIRTLLVLIVLLNL
jgi:hypothetical protein